MKEYKMILLLACLAACTKTEKILPEPKIVANFSATIESPTKLGIDDGYVLSWEQGDRIAVNDGVKTRIFTAASSGRSTVFSAEGAILSEEKNYCAVYPQDAAVFDPLGACALAVPSLYDLQPGEYPAIPAVA